MTSHLETGQLSPISLSLSLSFFPSVIQSFPFHPFISPSFLFVFTVDQSSPILPVPVAFHDWSGNSESSLDRLISRRPTYLLSFRFFEPGYIPRRVAFRCLRIICERCSPNRYGEGQLERAPSSPCRHWLYRYYSYYRSRTWLQPNPRLITMFAHCRVPQMGPS